MPQLIRLMLLHGALGFGVSAVFVALLIGTDTGGLANLLLGAPGHPVPVLLLWFFCGLTFGSAQIGTAVMLLGGTDETPSGGTRSPVAGPLAFRPALARARRR